MVAMVKMKTSFLILISTPNTNNHVMMDKVAKLSYVQVSVLVKQE